MTYYAHLPKQAHPSFYETVVAENAEGNPVTHKDVEQILSRPKWSFEKANRQAMRAINAKRTEKVGGRPKRGAKQARQSSKPTTS